MPRFHQLFAILARLVFGLVDDVCTAFGRGVYETLVFAHHDDQFLKSGGLHTLFTHQNETFTRPFSATSKLEYLCFSLFFPIIHTPNNYNYYLYK